jgi:CubicO group peptidase (beta-lactamase class C family)
MGDRILRKRLKVKLFNFLLFIFSLSLVTSHSTAQINSLDHKSIDKVLPQILDSAAIPGFSFAIINNSKTEFYKTYGVKSLESNERVNDHTIFEAASLTKPLLAYCVLKLVEQGKIDLDMPLYKYLEYEPVAHDERYKAITARMVLSHSSGFPNWRSDRNGDTLNIRFQPGLKFGYSGEGFVYLQKVVEHILDQDLNTLASRYVFDPLKMTRSTLIFNNDENYAIGHGRDLEPKRKFQPNTPNAAYSLHTTAGDYAKFLNELINPHFLGKNMTNQMSNIQKFMKEEDTSLAWGLGVGLNIISDDTLIWHWGDNGIFKSFFIVSIKSGLGFAYFSNSMNGLSVINSLIKLVYANEEIMENWNAYDQY